MQAHTPGPWFVVDNGHYLEITISDHLYAHAIGDVCASKHLDGGDNSAANARLIAAAPDLLTALQALEREFADLAESGDAGFWKVESVPEIVQARAAIAKATGG